MHPAHRAIQVVGTGQHLRQRPGDLLEAEHLTDRRENGAVTRGGAGYRTMCIGCTKAATI